jgi:hypothetical protein
MTDLIGHTLEAIGSKCRWAPAKAAMYREPAMSAWIARLHSRCRMRA